MRLVSLLAISVLVSACGGGSAPMQAEKKLRALPTAVMQQKSVAYSPFRTANRDTENITKLMIQEDLGLLQQAGFGLIRLFDSTDEVAKQTLEVIRDSRLPIKVMLGMYVNPNAEQSNQAELQRGIKLAKDHSDTVVALSVGNETMVSWSFVPIETSVMASYLRQVRTAVSQPVTTNDNWAFFANTQGVKPPADVLENIDFVAMHTYPLLDTIHNPQLWSWQQSTVSEGQRAQAMMDAALKRVQFEYQAVRQHLNTSGHGALPIMIGETGWKAEPSSNETQRAHPVNQKMYFERLENWKASGNGPVTVVHFEAFDEPWKQGDDKWGLFDVQRRARCVALSLKAQLVPAPGSCDATEAQYFKTNTNGGPVTTGQFTVYAEANTSGETRPEFLPALNAWENGTTANAKEVNESSGDGSKSIQVNPTPASWGWGMTWSVAGVDTDLSNFTSSNARLNFRIKTTYPGKLEIGFLTGATTDSTARDVYLPIASGEYGYQNDGAWHLVSVPMSALIVKGAPAFNMPSTAVLQMSRVSNLFVIADRYDKTGKAQNANVTTPILVDGIHWTR
jgi:exo-beta-1,3-glucanase (GH17 family)